MLAQKPCVFCRLFFSPLQLTHPNLSNSPGKKPLAERHCPRFLYLGNFDLLKFGGCKTAKGL